MICYKIDLCKELEKAGYTTYRIRKEKIMSQPTLKKLRTGEMVGIRAIDQACRILKKQPGDIIEYKED